MRDIFKKFLYYMIVFFSCKLCGCYRILVVFPLNSKSHRILGDACVDLLLEAGHQVTYITWGPVAPHQNLSVIDIRVPILKEVVLKIETYMDGEVGLDNLHELTVMLSEQQRKLLENNKIQTLLNNPEENFDVAILEWLFEEYTVGFAAVFGCPYIWFSSMEPHPLILGLMGEVSNPAYIALSTFKNIPPFTFMQRVKSLRNFLSIYLHREYYIHSIEEREYERVIGPLIAKRWRVVPSYHELRYNASLVLGNSHISVGRAIQLPAAYKEVGGFHVKRKGDPLPKNLKVLMDNSTNGLIYFSMGSVVDSQSFPTEVIKRLLKVFGDLKETVLWKFEADLPDKPSNVHIVSWAPQQSILAHPNCILFISHGGQHSVLETVHYGVPLIGIPVFADQEANIKRLVVKGMAKHVALSFDMAEDLKAAIKEILGNSSYAEAASRQSFIYHHRPVSPTVELVHWVEHVIQTNGAAHLRFVTHLVPWYQRYYLDLILIVCSLVILFLLAIKRLFSLVKSKELSQIEKKKLQ